MLDEPENRRVVYWAESQLNRYFDIENYLVIIGMKWRCRSPADAVGFSKYDIHSEFPVVSEVFANGLGVLRRRCCGDDDCK